MAKQLATSHMPRAPIVIMLPSDLREQVDARLRASGYTTFEPLAQWLDKQGHRVSKSALHRYAARLRAVDAQRGSVTAQVLLTPAKPKKRISAWYARGLAANAELNECLQQLRTGLDGRDADLRQAAQQVFARLTLLRAALPRQEDAAR